MEDEAEVRLQLAEYKRRATQAEASSAADRIRLDEEIKVRKAAEQAEREAVEGRMAAEQAEREAVEGRMAAEQAAGPTNFVDFIKSCHDFTLGLRIVTEKSLTTQGVTTKPANRPYPHRIVPWDDFITQQENIWEKLESSTLFTTQKVYTPTPQLGYIQERLKPISSEQGLRHFAWITVEDQVETLVQEICKDIRLRERLELVGSLTFEDHTNLGKATDEGVEGGSMSASKEQDIPAGKRHKHSGITGSADQFCIYQLANGQKIPKVLIEYKPPHKLPLGQITMGLQGEIYPAEEVIGKEGDSPSFHAKSLLAAVITQLFASMIGKGVQRGYIFTGQAIIFLNILDDPAIVQYSISIPSMDVQDIDEHRFHRTSVAQITAFVLNAFPLKAPGQLWYTEAGRLATWDVEYINVLKNIPETIRKTPFHSSYKPGQWKRFVRSAVRTRAYCASFAGNNESNDQYDNGGESDDNQNPPTPTPNRAGRSMKQDNTAPTRQPGTRSDKRKRDANEHNDKETISRVNIEDRPYCTHQCLLGLTSGGPLDEYCPNLKDHPGQHLQLENFLHLLRVQLATDRGPDADCRPLYVQGSRGALVKIRLSLYGYTLVAKAMKHVDRQHLLQEAKVYSVLKSLQGSRIPVCLGILNLDFPFYYNYGAYANMLLLSWAGRPLHQYIKRENEVRILDEVTKTLTDLHRHQVLHKDVELRNWLWDEQRVMLVDFERAEIRVELNPSRKRNRQERITRGTKNSVFDREIQSARYWLSQVIV